MDKAQRRTLANDFENLLEVNDAINRSKSDQAPHEWLPPINLLRAPCTYPRSKTAGYYGAENQKRRATLTSKTQTKILPVARPRGITS